MSLPDEINVSDPDHAALIRSRRDPELWHNAVFACLCNYGDPHGLVPWIIDQPELDRATAGWLFLWAEGSLYLAGDDAHFDYLDWLNSETGARWLGAICRRSEERGFGQDVIGLGADFEPERRKCVDLAARGGVAAGRIFPHRLLATPFPAPMRNPRYAFDDGPIIPLTQS